MIHSFLQHIFMTKTIGKKILNEVIEQTPIRIYSYNLHNHTLHINF